MERINSMLCKTKEILERYSYVFLFLIFAVFLFSRLFRLSNLPYGVHVDEIAGALDGYYLSYYGMDRSLVHMPPYLENYGGGQSAMYAYCVALLLKLIPFSIVTMRLPSVIWGCVCFFYSYRLIKELYVGMDDARIIALLGPVFVTIMPFFMSSQRWGLDCNLYLSLATISLFYFIRSMRTSNIYLYILTGVWLGITLYTYALSYVITLLFLLGSAIYMLYLKRFDIKKWIAMGTPCFIIALPLILFQFVNMNIIPEFSALGMDFKKLGEYRAGEITLKNIVNNISFIPKIFLGNDGLPYNAFNHTNAFGTVYMFMVPVIITGLIMVIIDIVKSTREKESNGHIFILIFFIVSLLMVMFVDAPSINKANQIFITFVVFAVYCIVNVTKKWHLFTPIILTLSAVFFFLYARFYFKEQKDYYGHMVLFYGTPAFEVVKYAEDMYNPDGNKTVYFEEQYDDQGAEVLLLSALKDIPPWEFDYERTEFKNVKLHFPEFDENEDAIYILGYNWDFIASYLTSIGFNMDAKYENYYILYR